MKSRYAKCAAQHFGPWCIEPKWFSEAVAAYRADILPVVPDGEADVSEPYDIDANGIARIPIEGHMTKAQSSFGGTSTVQVRRNLRAAVNDPEVKGILLLIDSPGGTVAGTAELADEVQAANELKPVYAYIEDLGASAAYWVASQARRISANATAEVGSIGVYTVVDDTSELYKKEGVKVHVISTGKHKGAFVDGAPVTDDQLEEVQGLVDDLNGFFTKAIKQGRGMGIEAVRKLATGQVWLAEQAQEHGLIDAVEPADKTVKALLSEIRKSDTPRRDRASRAIRLNETIASGTVAHSRN